MAAAPVDLSPPLPLPLPEQPERDCRRKIGCRLMNLGNSCYQNWWVARLD